MTLLIVLTILFPPSYARPQFTFNADTLVITVTTKNPSASAKLVFGKVVDPLDFNFESYQISRKTDTLHLFKLANLSPEELYVFKIAFFDTVTKLYYSTQNYFFKVKWDGEGLKEGLFIDVGPYLSLLDENDVGVAFYTNRPSKAQIYLNDVLIFTDTVMSFRHEFILKDLIPGNYKYFIKIFDNDDTTCSFTYKFRIQKYPKVSFGIFSDTRGNPNSVNPAFFVDGVNEEICRSIMRNLYTEGVSAAIVLGDLVTGRMKEFEYAEEEYKSFLKSCWPYSAYIPILPVPGNHDMITPVLEDEEKRYDPPPPFSAEDLWRKIFTLPENGPENKEGFPPYKENVYYISFGKLTFYFLNSDYNYISYKKKPNPSVRLPDEIQRIWLKDQIKNNSKSKINVLCFHEPLVGLGIEGRGDRTPQVDSFADFVKNLGFKFYISSHDHMYARGKIFNGLIQIVTAGGGAPLYDLKKDLQKANPNIEILSYKKTFNYLILRPYKGNKVKITAQSLTGQLIEEVVIP
ncbi:MAG: metallophosphoesterase [candidate division WOR-3 bacterium]